MLPSHWLSLTSLSPPPPPPSLSPSTFLYRVGLGHVGAAYLGMAAKAQQSPLPGQQRMACHRGQHRLWLQRLLLPILCGLLEAHLPTSAAACIGGLGRWGEWVVGHDQSPGETVQIQPPDVIKEATACAQINLSKFPNFLMWINSWCITGSAPSQMRTGLDQTLGGRHCLPGY